MKIDRIRNETVDTIAGFILHGYM